MIIHQIVKGYKKCYFSIPSTVPLWCLAQLRQGEEATAAGTEKEEG